MDWSKSSLNDPIRKKKVPATMEEKVRQWLLAQMIGPLGFPKGLISVEKKLSSFDSSIPKNLERRVDIIVFYKQKENLLPLLVVECKEDVSLLQQAEDQVFGYNEWILAPFVAVSAPFEIKTFWKEGSNRYHVPFLPPYQELVKRCHELFAQSSFP